MHNLLLGTAKHVTQIWLQTEVIKQDSLAIIQARVNNIKVPVDLGRIPSKIECHFSGFTADEWKNWTLVYSLICLKDIIADKHYVIWSLFVKASIILLKREVSQTEVMESHRLLIVFCKKFEAMYGKEKCTMNMHLHQHLKRCILDFGPAYVFWCFSFERMNGILGSYPTNNQSIEIQMMRRFNEFKQSKGIIAGSDNFSFDHLLKSSTAERGTLKEIDSLKVTKMLLPCKECTLSGEEKKEVSDIFCQMYPNNSMVMVNEIKQIHKLALLNGKSLTVESRNQRRPCYVLVKKDENLRVCQINDLLTINAITTQNSKKQKISLEIMRVKYFKQHTEESSYARPVIVACPEFDNNIDELVPLSSAISRCVVYEDFVKFAHGKDKAVIAMPLP